MPALTADPQLIISAFLRMVRGLFPTGALQIAWLSALQQQALIGSTTGITDALSNLQDWGAVNLSNDGASTQWVRSMDAPTVAAVCEAVIQIIEDDGDTPGSASDRTQGADFSRYPTRLG